MNSVVPTAGSILLEDSGPIVVGAIITFTLLGMFIVQLHEYLQRFRECVITSYAVQNREANLYCLRLH